MADQVLIGRTRGGASDGQYGSGAFAEHGEFLTSQGLPPYTEPTRHGDGWSVSTATPFAPGVALPTTLAKLEVKNNRLGYVMLIDTIWCWQLLGTAVVWAVTPWAQVGAAVVSSLTALTEYSASGKSAVVPALTSDAPTAVDQTVVANGWRVFPGSSANFGLAAATPGGAIIGEVAGRLLVPYGKALHVMVTGSVATASSMHCGASWFWAAITNEG